MASAPALAGLAADLHGPRLGPSPDSDSDTDSEEPSLRRSASGLLRSQVIHSGHFMVSSPHRDSLTRRRAQEGPVGFGNFGPRSIDPTLTRLFECMSLAYSGKLVSPKWKNFKGLKLLCRDKIRLNNAIWRAWYTQYVERKKSPVCSFVTPLQGSEADEHRKPQAVVLEGSYWKRRIEVVMREYHKWRIYYKKRLRKSSREGDLLAPKQAEGGWQQPELWCQQLFSSVVPVLLGDPEEEPRGLLNLDCFLSDISDTLFTMTQPGPPPLPLPPDDAYAGNADMIQPDLTPLQPSLDDFMEISDFFTNYRPPQPPMPLHFPEPPSFNPMADSLFSSGILSPDVPPTPPSSGLTHLSGNCLQVQNSCPSPLDSSAYLSPDFLLPEDHKPKLPSPPSPPSYPLPYSAAVKVPGLEPYPPPHYPPMAPPPTLLPEEPLFSPRFPFSVAPSVTGLPTLSPSPTFLPSSKPDSGPAPAPFPIDLLPSRYPEPALGTAFAMPRGIRPRGKPPTPCPRVRKPSPTTLVPATASPTATSGGPNPCLTQLLTAAKPEQALDPPRMSSSLLLPTGSPQETLPEFPCTFLPPIRTPTPPRPSLGPATPAPPGPLIVPKAERLSPPAPSGGERRLSGELGSIPGPSICVSPSPPTLSRGRPDSSKSESRRVTHISAEQKRRFNIKLGFDTLHGLVSTLSMQPSIKVSKATTLQKTAEYIAMLQQERAVLQEEAQQLRDQIEELNAAINQCQQQLPATGVPITHQRFDQMRDMFDNYVRTRTLHNWKFWVFSILIRPLFESFNGMVSTASLQSLRQTSLAWLDQHCSLPTLRPTVLSALRQLSTSTCILTEPGRIPEQATKAVTEGSLGKPV
ncbi:carbohydrate-responsive element-binding protein isoform X1 [Echinops telfairi]|uniref:Carbohydrate-responsive element-binding protein isoform X1 n=1 Tax=Echinops telfairi TaxID=9371 RepID=A0ABM0IQW9_ECHTE|nr:carbohydrate-responsive element-binding protein isoform X1 [Echinops telfairi]